MAEKELQKQSVLGDMPPAKSIVKLAIPATLALMAKAVYNLVDTAYIGMLGSDIALTAVGSKGERSCKPHSYNDYRHFCYHRRDTLLGRYRLSGAAHAGVWRFGCVTSTGKRLCFLDVCGGACQPPRAKHELRCTGGVFCQNILHCGYYRRNAQCSA